MCPDWRKAVCGLAAGALLWALGGVLRADGFHLPNFYESTVLESWAKLKTDFKFPDLPPDKTWSDVYPLGPLDSKVRSQNPLRGMQPPDVVLRAVIVKMIAAMKYTDPYNFAYDSPPWLRTAADRERSIKEALAVLKEIGFQSIPYLWEQEEDQLRFENHPRKAGIAGYRMAQTDVALAIEALRDAMRKKEPKWAPLEDELAKIVADFWRQSNILGSAAGKLGNRYDLLLREMDKLILDHGRKDPEIKKLDDAKDEADRKAKAALGKCPGEYFTSNEFRVSDDFHSRLRDAIVQCGPQAKAFLRNHLRDPVPALAAEAKLLLERMDKEAEAKAPRAGADEGPINIELPTKKQEAPKEAGK